MQSSPPRLPSWEGLVRGYTQAKVMGNIKIRNWKSQVWYLEMPILESRKTKFSKQKCTY